MITITSAQNPVIKEIKALKQKKHREENKQYFIEGIRFVEEALKEGAQIVKILISDKLIENKGGEEILSKIKNAGLDGCEVFMLTDKLFVEISDTENPQGIMAVIRLRLCNFDEIFGCNKFLIILDSIQDPGNLGTIIRTADGAGAGGIVISKGCVDPYNPKVLRSTMGSIFRMPVYFSENLPETIDAIKSRDIKVCAAHLKGTANYFDIDMKNGIALIIGNEANGISGETAARADMLVKIPMSGGVESLNASVAAALLMYEVVRQRMNI